MPEQTNIGTPKEVNYKVGEQLGIVSDKNGWLRPVVVDNPYYNNEDYILEVEIKSIKRVKQTIE